MPYELHIFPNGGHGLSLATPQVCTPEVFPNQGDKSFAQLSPAEKDALSHRGNALRLISEKLKEHDEKIQKLEKQDGEKAKTVINAIFGTSLGWLVMGILTNLPTILKSLEK